MNEVASIIMQIKNTPSANEKKLLLKKYENEPGLKEILHYIYNPYSRSGISATKLSNALNKPTLTIVSVTYREMIEYLLEHNTGSDADLDMAARFIKMTPSDEKWLAKAIVTQNLQIGVTAKTLNKMYGSSFIPIIGCMLGTKVTDVPPHKIKWPCVVTEKLDGIRRILVKQNGVSRMYSRSGHEDEGLVEIMAEAKHLPDNRVYDCELLAIGYFKDSIALRQASMSLSAVKGTKRGLSCNMFDMVPVEEFLRGTSEDGAAVRKLLLGATLMDDSIQALEGLEENWPKLIASYGIHKELNFIKHVPILGFVNSMEEVTPIVEAIWDAGGEGVMLNTAEGLYEVKRSKELLKVKRIEELVLPVVDVLEGSGKYEDMMGSLVVEYKGYKVGVGSGFTDSQRQKIWNNPNDYIGKLVEIDTFGESTNQAKEVSINCPIFKRFAGEVE